MTSTPGDPAGFFSDGAPTPPSPTPDAAASAAVAELTEPAPDAAATHTPAASTPAPAASIPPSEGARTDEAKQAGADADTSVESGSGFRPREAATPQPSHQNDTPADALSPTRPAYMQQFTLTTQLILNRMRGGEGGGLSSALASAAANTPRAAILSPTYEDVRRRLLDGMSTSTMQMPSTVATAPFAPSSASSAAAAPGGPATAAPQRPAGLSAIQKVNAGIPSGVKARGKTAADGKGAGAAGRKPRASNGGVGRGGARAGQKRKRMTKSEGAGFDDSSSLSDLSGLSDAEGSGAAAATATAAAAGTASASASASSTPLTTTKSGRQVQRPETYNPVAMELASGSGHKRRRDAHHGGAGGKGHRTAEQALCRLCSRLAFTKANQMVFCDGCNDAWHQNCHEPYIDDSFVNDAKKQWHCSACTAKQDRREAAQQAKRVKIVPVEPAKSKVSWAGRTPGQRRAYLSALPHTELVEMVMRCTSLYPHLAIFPPDEDGAGPKTPVASSNGNAVNTPAPAAAAAAVATPTPAPAARQLLALNDGTWEDPAGILEAWKRPRPGAGPPTALAARLQVLEAGPGAHLEDADDFESFSHTLYDGRGHKLEENGIRV